MEAACSDFGFVRNYMAGCMFQCTICNNRQLTPYAFKGNK